MTSGPSECNGLCGTEGCSACPTVPMVDAGGFFVDAYEVSRGEYSAFLADGVDTSAQIPVCTWNDTFEPVMNDAEAGCTPEVYDMSMTTFAIGCIDWCDAAAFCAWAGKRLCRRTGGGTVPEEELNDATKSEWYSACSAAGKKAFPYGDTFDDNACNTSGNSSDVVGVGSYPDCEGGYPGVFDMVGNAEEWEDACDISADPAGDNCAIRGGAFWTDSTTPDHDYATCVTNGDRRPDRQMVSHDWGFRCCKDP